MIYYLPVRGFVGCKFVVIRVLLYRVPGSHERTAIFDIILPVFSTARTAKMCQDESKTCQDESKTCQDESKTRQDESKTCQDDIRRGKT